VHPYLLESLLKREFEQRNIGENFEYGVYDCFTDSIVFGNYVPLDSDTSATRGTAEVPHIKWEKDGHYFGVFFPDREPFEMQAATRPVSTWAFSAIISFIVFLFFAYTVYLVLRQKRLSEMKTDFINNMTHELKTPISTISLSSEVLLGDGIENQPERRKQYAKLIYNENQRLRLQVDKVLQLASLDREKVQLQKEKLDLHRFVHEAKNAITMVRNVNEVEISLQLDAVHHHILADPVHVSNIIHNLLDNAMKYSREKPKIKITTENENGWIVLHVNDNGIGIPQKSLKYIFDKFYRVHTGNVHDVKGFGLGLFYVQQMMAAHKGKINVTSKEGKGTNFKLYFSTTE
jgi:two-component system phosphate regulon sensor histidine kinase PhoR